MAKAYTITATNGEQVQKKIYGLTATNGVTQFKKAYGVNALGGQTQIWTGEIALLDSTNGSSWSSYVYNATNANGTSIVDSDGSLYAYASTRISSLSDIRAWYKKLTECTSVTKLTIVYSNSANGFNQAATWVSICTSPTAAVFYSGNASSGEIRATNVGGSSHSGATITYTFDTATDLSNYYICGKVTTQGADIKPYIRLISVIAE